MKKYNGIDLLRVIGCISIMLMHIAANNHYVIDGFIYNTLIFSLGDFVYLFMAISAFGMCCGYYEKFMSGNIDIVSFYRKRYAKILPFFLVLIVMDLLNSFSVNSLFEGLTEMTLLHGFLPFDLSVIGVGWFLGVVFIFYLVFPYFCVLISTKSRAWFSFAVSMFLCYASQYFNVSRHNFLSVLCYFMIGGIVFLYRGKAEKRGNIYLSIAILFLSIVCYFSVGYYTITRILITTSFLFLGISIKDYNNKIISLISKISMEFYLSHMVVFRIIEALKLNTVLGNGIIQYIFSVSVVFIGTIVFSIIVKRIINVIMDYIELT